MVSLQLILPGGKDELDSWGGGEGPGQMSYRKSVQSLTLSRHSCTAFLPSATRKRGRAESQVVWGGSSVQKEMSIALPRCTQP